MCWTKCGLLLLLHILMSRSWMSTIILSFHLVCALNLSNLKCMILHNDWLFLGCYHLQQSNDLFYEIGVWFLKYCCTISIAFNCKSLSRRISFISYVYTYPMNNVFIIFVYVFSYCVFFTAQISHTRLNLLWWERVPEALLASLFYLLLLSKRDMR